MIWRGKFMKRKLFTTLIIISIIGIITGCSNNEFRTTYKKFNESYLLASDFIDKGNNTIERLHAIDESLIKTELIKMKEYIDFMNSKKKGKAENIVFNSSKNYYQNLEDLVVIIDNLADKDNVTEEEEFKVFSEISSISTNRQLISRSEY